MSNIGEFSQKIIQLIKEKYPDKAEPLNKRYK